MLPHPRQDPTQRDRISSSCASGEPFVGRKQSLRTSGCKRCTRPSREPSKLAKQGSLIEDERCTHRAHMAVVGLVKVPPLSSMRVTHCGQMARVTAIACGVAPTFIAHCSAVASACAPG